LNILAGTEIFAAVKASAVKYIPEM